MRSTSIEDYIKTIYHLEMQHERATTQRIARMLDVRMASVTGMIKHLAAEGYVRHKPYHGVKLTDKGREMALAVLRRHRLIELFLHRTLGMPWDEVHADAETLEHAASDRLIERIYVFLGRPDFDPHGAPIPRDDGTLPALDGLAMSDCSVGQRGEVLYVPDREAEFLRHLTSIGLRMGSRFRITRKNPADGTLTLRVGRRKVVVDADTAGRILVAVR